MKTILKKKNILYHDYIQLKKWLCCTRSLKNKMSPYRSYLYV